MKFSSLLHCKNHVYYANISLLKKMRVKSKSEGSLWFVVESLWELRVVGEIHEKKKKTVPPRLLQFSVGESSCPKQSRQLNLLEVSPSLQWFYKTFQCSRQKLKAIWDHNARFCFTSKLLRPLPFLIQRKTLNQ